MDPMGLVVKIPYIFMETRHGLQTQNPPVTGGIIPDLGEMWRGRAP